MTIEDAKIIIAHGTPFGEVYEKLEWGSRESLKEWYVTTPGLPNLKGREVLTKTRNNSGGGSGYTGDSCPKCGSMKTVRTGTCFVCQDCGESGGCG